MPYPTIIFSTIADWEAYVNTNVVTNGNEEITGVVGNNAYNGAVKFVKQSPLNWSKAAMYSAGGAISLANNFLGVAIFMTTTPTSISWGDNFYNQYVLINLTGGAIPLLTPTAYYDLAGNPVTSVPANTALTLFKASSDLWIQGANSGGTGSVQKEPKTYVVGTTANAPVAGTSTWQLAAFAGSWVTLVLSRSIFVDLIDVGDGSAFITKTLGSDTLTISNYTWNTGDILSITLITP